MRISEARDLGEVDRYKFYDHLKPYLAAPPDVLRCNKKNISEYAVLNVLRIILTTNYMTNGIYLPADDRRHFVLWSDLTKDDFEKGYFTNLWDWYKQGGFGHVAAYLRELDLSGFDPKAPPPKTEAWHTIVGSTNAPEDMELRNALDIMGHPDAFSIMDLTGYKEPG